MEGISMSSLKPEYESMEPSYFIDVIRNAFDKNADIIHAYESITGDTDMLDDYEMLMDTPLTGIMNESYDMSSNIDSSFNKYYRDDAALLKSIMLLISIRFNHDDCVRLHALLSSMHENSCIEKHICKAFSWPHATKWISCLINHDDNPSFDYDYNAFIEYIAGIVPVGNRTVSLTSDDYEWLLSNECNALIDGIKPTARMMTALASFHARGLLNELHCKPLDWMRYTGYEINNLSAVKIDPMAFLLEDTDSDVLATAKIRFVNVISHSISDRRFMCKPLASMRSFDSMKTNGKADDSFYAESWNIITEWLETGCMQDSIIPDSILKPAVNNPWSYGSMNSRNFSFIVNYHLKACKQNNERLNIPVAMLVISILDTITRWIHEDYVHRYEKFYTKKSRKVALKTGMELITDNYPIEFIIENMLIAADDYDDNAHVL